MSLTRRSYAERVADYQLVIGNATAEHQALFAGAKWIDARGELPQDRDPLAKPVIGQGLTVIAERADYVLWCTCVDEHLERWDETSPRHRREPASLRDAMSPFQGDEG